VRAHGAVESEVAGVQVESFAQSSVVVVVMQ